MYDLLDKAVLSTFKKVEEYRDVGSLYLDYEKSEMKKIEKTIPQSIKKTFLNSLENPAVTAYLEVLGQLTIIDLDIAGYNVNKEIDKSLKASFSVGLAKYNIKLIDNLIDKKENNLDHKANLLKGFLYLMKNKGDDSKLKNMMHKKEVLNTAEIISCLQNIEPLDKLSSHYTTLENLVISEINNQSAKNDIEKYNAAVNVGKYSGELVLDIISDFFPEFRERMEKHYLAKGKAANIFDDLKDFKLDRKNTEGYSINAIPLLLAGFSKEFAKSFIYLKPKSAWKYFNFLMLGGLFQIQELVGLKERS